MTPAQKKALEVLWPKYGLNHDQGKIDFTASFEREAPRYLEIGFGMGDSLTEIARAHPENDYIGIEVHRPGVGSLLKTLQHQEIENVRVVCTDAVEVLKNNIPDNSLDGVYIYFPDPWHKKSTTNVESYNPLLLHSLRKNSSQGVCCIWQRTGRIMHNICLT